MYDFVKEENVRRISEWISNGKDGQVNFYPTYIQLEHTNRCNARCIMCNHFYLENKGAKDISYEMVKKIEPLLQYCKLIMLNGDGEPFLCKYIEKYISLYHKYGVMIGTNTNLCALTPKMISEVGGYIDFLNISCDGSNKELFENIRRGLKFETFIDNIKLLNKNYPNIRKNLDCVLMIQNINQVVELVRFAAEYNFDSIKFNMLGVNPCIGNEKDSLLNYPNAASFYLHTAENEAKRLNIKIIYPNIFKNKIDKKKIDIEIELIKSFDWKIVNQRLHSCRESYQQESLSGDYLNKKVQNCDLIENKIYAPELCQWAVERCYIDLFGNVSTCCYNVHNFMGNLLETESFEEIWNGKEYQLFRNNMKNGYLPTWCKYCGFYCGKIKTNFVGEKKS